MLLLSRNTLRFLRATLAALKRAKHFLVVLPNHARAPHEALLEGMLARIDGASQAGNTAGVKTGMLARRFLILASAFFKSYAACRLSQYCGD